MTVQKVARIAVDSSTLWASLSVLARPSVAISDSGSVSVEDVESEVNIVLSLWVFVAFEHHRRFATRKSSKPFSFGWLTKEDTPPMADPRGLADHSAIWETASGAISLLAG